MYEEYDITGGGKATMASLYQTICGAVLPTTTTTTIGTNSGASTRLLGVNVTASGSREVSQRQRSLIHGQGRALQATAAALEQAASAVSNDDLKEYTVGEWTQCTCYQACVQGIMTRDVTCLSEQCKAPKPETSRKCECHHCSNCSVLFNTTLFFISFIAQGIVALLVWLSLLYMSSIEEAALVRLSWFQWFLGFFVKQLPPLARLLILANVCQALMMVFQTWVPENLVKFQPDCNDVPQLRFLSLFLAAVMCLLLVIGRITRLFNRMMPYLHRPDRATSPLPIRLFSKLQALLGP
jgi:hypothetical protein